ncbi:hypothetical protein [Flavobacterium sp.]|uniref:hypothetical protein n=1 Tax=Flavobacterium sp. TaxID=239 RepID=UPI0026311FB9|nr:hypothetical protein [Flavobacterium sp.]
MKKFLGLLFLMLILNGCDDGDMTIETINFTDVQAGSCGETIYKLNGNEAIYIKIPGTLQPFTNEVTPVGSPKSIQIGSTASGIVSVTYRAYDGAVTVNNICTTPAPISPIATEEWIATSGTIEIATIAVYSTPDATTGGYQISKYLHNIVFKNVVFSKPSGTQVYERFPFGEYSTNATELPLNFDPEDISICPSNQLLYNARTNGIEGIYIQNFDPTLLDITNLGVPKTALISSNSNRLVYRLFQTALTASNQDYFCSGTLPATPAINEEWIAKDGVDNVSGIIEVVTTTNGSGYLHTITLKAATFQKDNNTFYLGNTYVMGTLLTAN